MHLTPAQYVIRVFKGVRATARAVGRTPSSVSKWQRTGVPSRALKKILEAAHERGLDLTANDLVNGRIVKETP